MAAASLSSSLRLAAGAASNAAESSNAITTNNDDDINSGGGSGQVEALANMQQQQQQQQQQQLQQRSSGGDIIVHLSRDWMALFLIYYQCSVNDLVPLLLDVCMNDYVGMVAKELVFSMKSPILYRRPDKKRAITDVLARAAVDIPCVIELISPEWPVRDKPKVPDEIMEELENTHCLQSTMGGVVLQYVLHGKGVM